MDKSDSINAFMNAKGELSMALQQLTAISENFFLAVELPQENLIEIKTVKLHNAVNTVDNLVNILSDIVGDSDEFESIDDKGEQECAVETYDAIEETENQVEVKKVATKDCQDLGINMNGKDEPEVGSKVNKLVSSVKRKLAEKEIPRKVSKKLKREKNSKLLDVSEMHNSTGGYSCQTCEKTFTQRRNLIVHIKTVHERIRIPCSLCDHTASTKSNLKVHMVKKHNMEKDDSVNYGVNNDEVVIDDYEVQTEKIDGDIEDYDIDTEESVECILEEYDTEIQDNVEDNEDVINDSMADTDNIKADGLDTLEISNVTEGYPCEKCNKTFTQKRNLQVHVKTVHEGIRIPCSMCDHTASTKSNLRKHMAKKHNVHQ